MLKPSFHEESTIVTIAISLAVGIGLYFSTPADIPPAFIIISTIVLLAVLARFDKSHRFARQSILMMMIIMVGYFLADRRSEAVMAPILPKVADFYDITGVVDERLSNGKGRETLIISDLSIENMPIQEIPERIRVQVRTAMDAALKPGDAVKFTANLSAPQGPVSADSFNFARNSYFDQVGGSGFAVSAIEKLSTAPSYNLSLNIVRHEVGLKLSAGLTPREAALATALLTGDRSALPPEVVDNMRDAGLAHLLAISGLHMGLVSATIFFIIEALFALWPAAALRVPPAKIAAVVAWVSALGYLMLSGMGVSTIRAFMMVTIALIGILLDRRAISLRSIALAAIMIMVIWPETLVSVGFQMSFAAVTALVVFYENWGRKLMFGGFAKDGKKLNFLQRLAGVFIAAISTTLVAELAIAPIALYHFQSVALYGLLANVVAVPLMSFILMPMLLFVLLLMPFGLEWLMLPIVEPFLAILMTIADQVSALPGSTASSAALPHIFILMAVMLGVMMTLVRGRIMFGIVPICLMILFMISRNTIEPDIYISKDGKILAVKQSNGLLAFNSGRHSYQKDAWRRMNGEGTDSDQPLPRLVSKCDDMGCLYRADTEKTFTIARVNTLEGLMSECGRSQIIIAQNVSARYCKSTSVVFGFRKLDEGPVSIWLEKGRVSRLNTVKESLGNRPWVQTE